MGFIWVNQYDCAACGTGATASETADDGFGFPVCPACSSREARLRQ